MDEVEQNSLLVEARTLMEEAAKAFFNGDIDRAADLAYKAYLKAKRARNANPTREGIDALVARLDYMRDSLEHFVNTAEQDV